jgi:hypothetical protein
MMKHNQASPAPAVTVNQTTSKALLNALAQRGIAADAQIQAFKVSARSEFSLFLESGLSGADHLPRRDDSFPWEVLLRLTGCLGRNCPETVLKLLDGDAAESGEVISVHCPQLVRSGFLRSPGVKQVMDASALSIAFAGLVDGGHNLVW